MKPNETIGVRERHRHQVSARIKERDGYVRHRTSHLVSDNARDHPVLLTIVWVSVRELALTEKEYVASSGITT